VWAGLCVVMLNRVTPERTLLSGFTAAVYDDEFQLIVRATTEQTFWDKVGRPFTMTLTPAAWAWVLVTLGTAR
jgi:hypothetical protein